MSDAPFPRLLKQECKSTEKQPQNTEYNNTEIETQYRNGLETLSLPKSVSMLLLFFDTKILTESKTSAPYDSPVCP